MLAPKIILASVLLVAVSARHIPLEAVPYGYDEEYRYPQIEDQEFEYQHPGYLANSRVRRQAQGSLTLNSDGSSGLSAKVPLVGNDKNILSAIGSVDLDKKMNMGSKGIGLAIDNVNGHSAQVMKETIPGFGSRLTAGGHATLLHNDNHDVGANAFISRNMPNIPQVPNFNTVGGGLDYTYKNKIGASVGMSHTPFLDRKDYSAMGNFNVFHNPTSSVDFSAGFKKFDTPYMRSGWEPNFMLKFGKSF